MSSLVCEWHLHQWEPIQGWVGRYRCSACKVIAYKGLCIGRPVLGGKRLTQFIPYKCQAKKKDGEHCSAPAVKMKPQRCVAHTKS
jgi:hypothetical protein